MSRLSTNFIVLLICFAHLPDSLDHFHKIIHFLYGEITCHRLNPHLTAGDIIFLQNIICIYMQIFTHIPKYLTRETFSSALNLIQEFGGNVDLLRHMLSGYLLPFPFTLKFCSYALIKSTILHVFTPRFPLCLYILANYSGLLPPLSFLKHHIYQNT